MDHAMTAVVASGLPAFEHPLRLATDRDPDRRPDPKVFAVDLEHRLLEMAEDKARGKGRRRTSYVVPAMAA